MKIKQQKQIKAFLIQAFGPDRGGALFARQEEILTALVEQVNDPSERRRETLIQTILPRIALYKALLDGCSEEETWPPHADLYDGGSGGPEARRHGPGWSWCRGFTPCTAGPF